MAALLLLVLGLQSSPLAERHRGFLEDEAHFLLNADERERFEALASDESRDRFIEAFWQHRDRGEHQRRLRACDRLFGLRGRWSERGRIYQLLGEPSYREDLSRAGHRIWPSELWHYTGVGVSFLPDSFYLIFFRPSGFAEYRLWNPDTEGVAALVPSAEPSGLELGADPALGAIDPELALAVKELVPGAGRRGGLSLLASLDAFTELAERARVFGEEVRVAVSTRELRSRLFASVLADDAGVPELHYALDLPPGTSSELHWRAQSERYRVGFSLVGRLVGLGLERERWEDSIVLDVSASEKAALVKTRLSFRGRRLVQPNDERFELALVTVGAGTVVAAPIDHDAAGVREGDFATALDEAHAPVRALVRERTRAEEGRYRFARGLALARHGDRTGAIEELEVAAELNEDEVRVHLELARLLYASRRYRDLLAHFGGSENRFVDEIDVWVMMAGSAEALGRAEDAVAHYDRALALAPDNDAIASARERAQRRLMEIR